MKRSNLLALGLGICLASSMAMAGNPETWNFTNLTVSNGGSTSWTSSTAVDNFYNHYNFNYTITKVEMYTGLFFAPWADVTDRLDPTDLAGSGGQDGTLPLTIKDETISQSGEYEGTPYEISADLSMWIDDSGYGHFAIDNVTLKISGVGTDMRFTGVMSTEGSMVPEPCTLAVLGCAAAGLIARRRNRK